MAKAGVRNYAHQLNHASPANADAQLGTTLEELIAGYNDLAAKYSALLAKLDTANVAGVGNNNAATLGPAKPTLRALGAR